MAKRTVESNEILRSTGKLMTLVQDLYSKSMSALRVDGELTEWFRIRVGVRQGRGMSPDLFNLILEIVMRLAKKGESDTRVKLNGRPVDNLRFPDDIDLLVDTKESLQDLTNRVHNPFCHTLSTPACNL